jgi:CubicO group peptidase (beta-lactamase class C family)
MKEGLQMDRQSFEDLAARLIVAGEAVGLVARDTGIAASVIRGGRLAYEGAFGLRDRARNLPVTTKTIFDVGSLTKSMTAAVLLQAHERNKLDIDEPLEAAGVVRLPGPAASQATLADVLAHRTALPAHDFLWYFGGYTTNELAGRVARLDPVPHAFRRTLVYNNALYGLTRLIVERQLGCDWERHVTDELLAPLGMTATTFGAAGAADDEALPYVGESAISRKDASCIAAAGGARSNLNDMTKWALFQLGDGDAPLSPGSRQTMHAAKISSDGMNPLLLTGLEWLRTSAYGYGWFLGEAAGKRAIHHMGFIDGFSSVVVLVPELEAGVVVLASANLSAFPGLLAQHLLAKITGEDAPPLTAGPPPPSVAADPAPRAEPSPGLEGSYEDAAYGRIDVVRRDDSEGLTLRYRGHDWPLRFHAPREAVIVLEAFGVSIPLPASFGSSSVSIPFSLDPRVPSQVFAR